MKRKPSYLTVFTSNGVLQSEEFSIIQKKLVSSSEDTILKRRIIQLLSNLYAQNISFKFVIAKLFSLVMFEYKNIKKIAPKQLITNNELFAAIYMLPIFTFQKKIIFIDSFSFGSAMYTSIFQRKVLHSFIKMIRKLLLSKHLFIMKKISKKKYFFINKNSTNKVKIVTCIISSNQHFYFKEVVSLLKKTNPNFQLNFYYDNQLDFKVLEEYQKQSLFQQVKIAPLSSRMEVKRSFLQSHLVLISGVCSRVTLKSFIKN